MTPSDILDGRSPGRRLEPAPYRIGAPVIVRVAGLPAGVLTRLRFRHTAARVRAVLAADGRIAAEAEALGTRLHALIGTLDRPPAPADPGRDRPPAATADGDRRALKPGLVGLRRAIHQGRPPRPAELAALEALAVLDLAVLDRAPALATWIRGHLAAVAERDRLAAGLGQVLAAELADRLPALAAAVADRRFRHGLLHSSEVLAAEVERWLADPARPPGPAAVSRLAKYVARVAAKTSPYSTFTVTGPLGWTAAGGAPLRLLPGIWDGMRGTLEPHPALAARLERALAGRPHLRPRCPVRLNPSAVDGGGRVRFLGPPPGEPLLEIASTAEVRAVLAALSGSPAPRTFDELRRALPEPPAGPAGRPDPRTAFLARLAEVGLVQVGLGVADQSSDPFAEIAAWLDGHGGTEEAAVAEACRALSAELGRPTVITATGGHRDRLAAVHRRIRDLDSAAGLGIAGPAPDARARSGPDAYARSEPDAHARSEPDAHAGTGPGTLAGLVHEHVVHPGPIAVADRDRWGPALADLDAIRRWIGPYEPGRWLRTALGAYHRARFGTAAVPWMRFHHALRRDLAAASPPRTTAATTTGTTTGTTAAGTTAAGTIAGADALADIARLLGLATDPPGAAGTGWALAELRELESARAAALAPLAARAPGPDGVVRVDPAELPVPAGPGWTAPGSVTCYVQPWTRGGTLRLVLTMMISGYGRGAARWRRLAGTGGAAPPAVPDGGTGPVLAESSGVFGTALNLRPAAVPYELDYPATTPARPADRRIALSDLVVAPDPRTGLLTPRSARLDREVIPVHGGMVAEFGLPPALSLLVRAFGAPTLVHPMMPVPAPPAWRGRPGGGAGGGPDTGPGTVVATPRLDVGAVTVRRAGWILPYAEVPVRAAGETDAGYLLRLHRWRSGHAIPARFFAHTAGATTAPAWHALRDKNHKPLYIDLDDWFLVTVFARLVRRPCAYLVLEEVLPALEDAPGPEGRVCELVVELSDAADAGRPAGRDPKVRR